MSRLHRGAVAVVVAAVVAGCAGGGEDPAEGEGEGAPCEGSAHLVADEESCDLGVVEVGASSTCTITIRNDGACPADIDDVGADFGAVDDVGASQVLPGSIDTLLVTVVDTPAAAGVHEGQVTIHTTDGAFFAFALREDARTGPTCAASASADHGFVDDVIALDSSASTGLASRAWGVTGAGALSSTTDVAPALTATALGSARVTLAGFDDAGFTCADTVDVRFDPRLRVALDASSFLAGFVAHVFPASEAACGALDCFDLDGCGFVAAAPLDWDGDGAAGFGDPSFDPTSGVQVALPAAGDYVVAVDAHGNTGDAAVDVTVNGVAQSFTHDALGGGELWTVATVAFPAGTITPVDTTAASPCP